MKKLLILGQIPKEHGGSYTTGVANVIMEISQFLKKDFDIHIYATNFKSNSTKNIDGIKVLGYSYKKLLRLVILEFLNSPFKLINRFKGYRKEFGISPIKTFLYYITLKDYLHKIKPDVINAHGIMFAPILKNFNINDEVFYSFHGFMYDDPNSIKANKNRGLDINKLYTESAKWIKRAIYLTDEMKSKGENNLGISTIKSAIIPNGVNVTKFKFCENSRSEIRKAFNLKDSETVYISVGALTNRKNHIGFIEFLLRNNFTGSYWIIGKFEAEETKNKIIEYQEKISQFKIKIINYLPHNELFKYYSAADLYAHPSTSEGQALVVFEALCCGLPIIANQEIENTVCAGKAYNDVITFIDMKNSLLTENHTINRNELSKKCKRDFNWENTSQKYKKVFLNETN